MDREPSAFVILLCSSVVMVEVSWSFMAAADASPALEVIDSMDFLRPATASVMDSVMLVGMPSIWEKPRLAASRLLKIPVSMESAEAVASVGIMVSMAVVMFESWDKKVVMPEAEVSVLERFVMAVARGAMFSEKTA